MLFDRLRNLLRRHPEVQAPVTVEPAAPPAPRILGFTLVKNEQDIIEPFLRHNAGLLDALVVVDNGSVDATRSIALACARELGNIVIADHPAFGFSHDLRSDRILPACQCAFFADYVIPLDADEFLGCGSRAELEALVSAIPPGGLGSMAWRSFVIRPGQEDAVAQDPPRGFTHRRRLEQPEFHKAVLRLDGAAPHGLKLDPGSHGASRGGQPVPATPLPGLPLLHVPVRSARQVAAKGVVAWMSRLAVDPAARDSDDSFQWRQAFDVVAQGGQEAAGAGLAETAMRYAQDRGPIDGDADTQAEQPPGPLPRRHSSGAFMDPLALVARSWEQAVTPPRPLLRLARPEGLAPLPGTTDTAFDAAWHWDHLFLDIPPFRFLAEKHQPRSVLDVGCGIGQYLALFRALGASTVLGVDGVPEAAVAGVLEPAEYQARDLAQSFDLGTRFDLVLCLEVAEHMAPADAAVLLDSVARHAGERIVFSAAEPDQPGHGHVNCRPLAEWLRDWADRGWVPDLVDSLGLRALATLSWFRRNPVVLRRGGVAEGAAATRILSGIAARPYAWYAQPPAIHEHPFAAPPPGPGQAYDAGPGPA
jgi:SAM-dependent methyltransferase